MARSPETSTRKNRSRSLLWGVLAGLLAAFFAYIVLREIIRRLHARRVKPTPPYIEIELEAPAAAPTPAEPEAPPFAEAPPLAAEPLEAAPPEAFPAEEEISFALSVEAVGEEVAPDPYTSVPSSLLVESYEPRYQFNWQNTALCESIYPFRKAKLIDFLAYFTEIDLYAEYKDRGIADAGIKAKIHAAQDEIQRKRVEVQEKLEQAITERQENDHYFAGIKGDTKRTLRFKQTYYLDREIDRLEEKLANLNDRRATFLKKAGWDTLNEAQRAIWQGKADELNPEISEIQSQLEKSRQFRELFELEAQLPQSDLQNADIEDVVRWEMRTKRGRWEALTQDELLEEIINDWFRKDPDRFPEWVIYMVIHFSGMRYQSSHASWADPCHLVELFTREELEAEVEGYQIEELEAQCNQALAELDGQSNAVPNLDLNARTRLKARLKNNTVRKGALLEYKTAKAVAKLERTNLDSVCLTQLQNYKQEKASEGDPIPSWVWSEIIKYTPLRLDTEDPNWEAYSSERWKWTNRQWGEILSTWEQKDITGWRQKHRESLELVVTRAVCNEIAEHIQHLRGITPAAGLTAKPNWYIRQAKENPGKAYFVQSPSEKDFRTGASILWLDWVDKLPNAWQIARPLSGFTFFSGQGSQVRPGMRGEVPRRVLEEQAGNGDGWRYQPTGDAFIRTRRLPSRQELKRMGKNRQEIDKLMAERKLTGAVDTQYLRWTHEATVIGVVDLVEGRYVMTFETGKIGVILRPLYSLVANPLVFVGYVPPLAKLPIEKDQKLVQMLRWDRILPEKNLPPRVRPRIKPDDHPEERVVPGGSSIPQRPVMVTRDLVKTWEIFGKDNQGQPKVKGSVPAVKLKRAMLLQVSTDHKESNQDKGDGIVHSRMGNLYKITACQVEPKAIGKFISDTDVVDYHTGKWLQVHPALEKTNPQVLKGYDDKGKPFFEPAPPAIRMKVQLPRDTRVRVSTTHKESFLDQGDGLVVATGLQDYYYLILECPDKPDAVGLFVEREEVVEAPAAS